MTPACCSCRERAAAVRCGPRARARLPSDCSKRMRPVKETLTPNAPELSRGWMINRFLPQCLNDEVLIEKSKLCIRGPQSPAVCWTIDALQRPPRTEGTRFELLFALPDPKQSPLDAMEALEARLGDEHQLADLHSGLLVGGDPVRLDHAGHSRLQCHFRKRPGRAAFRAEDGRKVAAAESVHEVVVYSEARVLDDARGVDDLLHPGAVADDSGYLI